MNTELCAQHFTVSKNFPFTVIRICNNILEFLSGNLKKMNCGTKLILHFKGDIRAL